MFELCHAEGRVRLRFRALFVGQDLCVIVDGGDKPHIGAVSMAACHVAAETLCLAGHKDDVLSKDISERLQKSFKHTVTCVCGIHIADITKEELRTVFEVVDMLLIRLIKLISNIEEKL